MGLREKKRDATRKALIEAAARLFAEREYDTVTVDEIAALAEVAKGTVYNYFTSKEEMAAALANDLFRQGLSVVDELLAAGQTPLDILHTLFIAGANWAEQNPRLSHVTLSHVLRQAFVSPHLRDQVEGYNSLFDLSLRLIEMGQSTGQIRSDVAAIEMAQMLALLYPQTLWLWTAKPEGEPLSARMERCLQICLEGMAMKEGKS